MEANTAKLWAKQDEHRGDRHRLFRAVAGFIDADRVLYPGSFVDIAPSFVFPSVTYVDIDKRTPRFFGDAGGICEIIEGHDGPDDPRVAFIHSDYTVALEVPDRHFDLLVSLYAGFISEHCTRYLRTGGWLLVNPSHGDAAMASIDPRYELTGAITAAAGDYRVVSEDLGAYLVPMKAQRIAKETLHANGRGVAYTKPAFAYLFQRRR